MNRVLKVIRANAVKLVLLAHKVNEGNKGNEALKEIEGKQDHEVHKGIQALLVRPAEVYGKKKMWVF